MKKRGGRVFLLLGIILIVIVAAALLLMSRGGGFPGVSPAQPTPSPTRPPVDAVVVIKEIQPNTVLTARNAAEYLEVRKVDAARFDPARHLTTLESTYNKRISSTLPLAVDTLLDRSVLVEPPISYEIPAGKKGVPLLVNATSGIGHLLSPGDVVDVILMYNVTVYPTTKPGQGNVAEMGPCEECPSKTLPVVKTVIQKVPVLRVVDYPAVEGRLPEDQVFLVLLAMSDQEAELVKFAELSDAATVQLVVRNYFDTIEEITTGITDKLLFDRYLPVPCPLAIDGVYPKYACAGGVTP